MTTPMPISAADLQPLLPELTLIGGAFALLMLDLFLDNSRRIITHTLALVVMAAATSIITEASPFIVRTSFTVPQVVTTLADWATKNNIKKVVSLVTDYAPGIDSEKYFNQRFINNGGVVIETLRVPLRSPDFAGSKPASRSFVRTSLSRWADGRSC